MKMRSTVAFAWAAECLKAAVSARSRSDGVRITTPEGLLMEGGLERLGIHAAAVLALGIIVTGLCLTTHALFMCLAIRSQGVFRRLVKIEGLWLLVASILLTTSILIVSAVLQVGVWSVVLWTFGNFGSLADALYFSATTYTTLGTGKHVLVPPFRLLEPLEAANGILAGGLNTAILFAILSNLFRNHRDYDQFFGR